jgi:hypothetical protein
MSDPEAILERPTVQWPGVNPTDVADEVVKIILAANQKQPVLFSMGDELAVLLKPPGQKKPYEWLKPLDSDGWFSYVADEVDFQKPKGEDLIVTNPPPGPMRIVPTKLMDQIPHLDGLVHTPYLSPDGTLVTQSGYNPKTRLHLVNNGFTMPSIPDKLTKRQVQAAVDLFQEWLIDFPFADEASRTVPIAQLLSHTGRNFVGLIPLFVYDASTAGSGKGLLIHTATVIATGFAPRLQRLPSDDAEQEKTITSILLDGHDPIVWDESHTIGGHTLAMLLTAERYSARVLGVSKMMSVENKTLQVAAGNNVQVVGDLKRRVVVCRLEPVEEHPEERTNFKHPDLKGWVADIRGDLLAAAFTLWRYWWTHGKPEGSVAMGSYERWSRSVGGCLELAGIEGFLSNTSDWLADGSDEDDWHPHLIDLKNHFGLNRDFTVSQVVRRIQSDLIKSLPYYPRENYLGHTIGQAYKKQRGKWWGDLRLVSSSTNSARNGAKKWRVIDRSGITTEPTVGAEGQPADDTDLQMPGRSS